MARRPIFQQEPRGSKDPRVEFVPVPNSRALIVGRADNSGAFSTAMSGPYQGAIVWIQPCDASDQAVASAVECATREGAARVLVLPRDAEDVDLPANAGSPSPTSDVSEVRPVVAELVADLPEELREDVAAFVERELSEAGL
jgi:hypothetical protein